MVTNSTLSDFRPGRMGRNHPLKMAQFRCQKQTLIRQLIRDNQL
jgi:hypothetical protein